MVKSVTARCCYGAMPDEARRAHPVCLRFLGRDESRLVVYCPVLIFKLYLAVSPRLAAALSR